MKFEIEKLIKIVIILKCVVENEFKKEKKKWDLRNGGKKGLRILRFIFFP